MSDINQGSLFDGNIAYHDYLVMLYYTDAEWSQKRLPPRVSGETGLSDSERKSFLRDHRHFINKCRKFKGGVNENYTNFCCANDSNGTEPMEPYLFNPMCFFPFGHADDLVIVLLDDFDPVHALTAEIETTVEEVCLAFCPKLESLGIRDSDHTFCELHTLPSQQEGKTNALGGHSDITHRFQKETPLMVFTKYKMDGLAILGEGLLFQQNLFKAMAKKIQEVVTSLREGVVNNDSTVADLMNEGDINTARCAFLDLQGAEEIGTLIFCRNYSVAITLVSALRSLTYSEVFDADASGHIQKVLGQSKSHQLVIQISRELRKEEPSNDIGLLRDNHVFKWTRTSLAVSPKEYLDPPKEPVCSGFVEAFSEFQIAPGHRSEVEKNIKVRVEGDSGKSVKGDTKYHWCHIGTEDLIFEYSLKNEKKQRSLLPISSLLSKVAENFYRFGFKKASKDHGRNVVDIITAITVPVPIIVRDGVDLICGRVGEKHFSLLGEMLPLIQQKRRKLDSKLKERHCKLGIPVSLRRTIEYLYQNFAILMGDLFSFDAVIDLGDTFATLHAVLTDYLPKEVGLADDGWLDVLDEGRVEQLSMLVGAIQNALIHRLYMVYPETQFREMAIDFRGGLNQVLLASDVAVKYGVKLLRKCVPEIKMVGGLTRIGFAPGAKCYSLRFGTEKKAQLVYFEVDVPHVLHVASYLDNLHECFHIIFNALRGHNAELSSISEPVMKNRIGEIFAHLLSQMFIFGSDVEKFLYCHIASYSKSIISIGRDDCETVVRFTELLIRLFLVKDAVPSDDEEPRFWGNYWIREKDSVGSAFRRFRKMVKEFGPFFSEYQRLWNGNNRDHIESYCWEQFKEIYPKVSEFMPAIWSEAIGVYKKFLGEDDSYGDEAFRKTIAQSLNEGKPLIRSLYENRHHNAALNPFVLICNVLREYVPELKEVKGKAIHLYRDPQGRKVRYPKGVKYLKEKKQLWHEFQLDKGSESMFCPVPSARRRRLRKQIVILKTFWDTSSKLREQQLLEIILDNWPELKVN